MIMFLKDFLLYTKIKKLKSHTKSFFVPENLIPGKDEEHISPSGKYQLIIQYYKTKEGCWEYSQGSVYSVRPQPADGLILNEGLYPQKKRKDPNAPIAVIQRNYSDFWHTWVNHPNGNEYLLCGENYQGYGIINLTKKTGEQFLPPEAMKGNGFCWISCKPSPKQTMLAVLGCYWGGPEDLVIYDFVNPDHFLPFTELKRFQFDEVHGDLKSWQWLDNDRICALFTEDYSIPDNKSMDDIFIEKGSEYYKKLCEENQVKEVEKEIFYQI